MAESRVHGDRLPRHFQHITPQRRFRVDLVSLGDGGTDGEMYESVVYHADEHLRFSGHRRVGRMGAVRRLALNVSPVASPVGYDPSTHRVARLRQASTLAIGDALRRVEVRFRVDHFRQLRHLVLQSAIRQVWRDLVCSAQSKNLDTTGSQKSGEVIDSDIAGRRYQDTSAQQQGLSHDLHQGARLASTRRAVDQ